MASKIFQNMKKEMKLFFGETFLSLFLCNPSVYFILDWIKLATNQVKFEITMSYKWRKYIGSCNKRIHLSLEWVPLENHDMQKQKCSSSPSSFLLSSSFFCTTLQSLGFFFGHTLKLARHFSDSLTQPNRSIFLGSQIKMNKQRIHWTKRTTSTRGQKKTRRTTSTTTISSTNMN